MFSIKIRGCLLLAGILSLSACSTLMVDSDIHYQDIANQQQSILEINDLRSQYLMLMDQLINRDEEKLSAETIVEQLFVESGAYVVIHYGENKRKTVQQGRDVLVSMFKSWESGFSEKPGHYAKHFSMNPQVKINGNTATVREEFLVLHSDSDDEENMWVIGHYEDLVEKSSDGKWRYKSLTAHVENISKWPSTSWAKQMEKK